MSQWKNPPRVVVLCGENEFLVSRELREAVGVADAEGRSVEYVDGRDREELSRVLSSTGVLFSEEVLLVVPEAGDVDVDLMTRHHESGNSDVTVVLVRRGNVKKGSNLSKIVKAIPDRYVANFKNPKPWEADGHAATFCAEESRRRGVEMSEPLARALVKSVGTDLGMLCFEVEKMCLYAKTVDASRVEIEHLRQVVGAFSEIGPLSVVEALERGSEKGVVSALANVRRTHTGNLSGTTLRCCAFVVRSATKWLHVVSLSDDGASLEEISERTKTHSYVLRKNVIPAAKRWGQVRLIDLIRSLADVERAVRKGHVHPWVQFECAVINSFTSGGRRAG